jgi:hypothetical protein
VSLQNFTLLAKLEALDLEGHKIVKKFEKSEKHVLSAEIRHTNSELLHLIIRAAKTQLEERRTRHPLLATRELLWRADVELEYLKLQVRKSFALRLINEKTYEDWSRMIRECGSLLGAWIKKVNENVDKTGKPSEKQAQARLL